MDSNKDSASECLNRGLRFLDQNEFDKALRFFQKSERLYETARAKELIKEVEVRRAAFEKLKKNGASTSSSSASTSAKPSTTTNRRSHASEKESSGNYTPEQLAAVKKINQCKDHYDVLGIPKKTSDEKLIKKSYRKLALRFHPDKNHAPGADEAFKKIGKAFQVLSDSTSRSRYDMYGDDTPQSRGMSGGAQNFQNVSAEELFQMFFNGGVPRGRAGRPNMHTFHFGGNGFGGGNRQQRRQQTHGQRQQAYDVPTETSLLQLLIPIVLLFLFLFSGSETAKPFSFRSTPSYPVYKRTQDRNVDYYVATTFDSKYGAREKSYYEREVERDWESLLLTKCRQEKETLQRELNTARYYRHQKQIEILKARRLNYCEKLTAFRAKSPNP